jgi:lipoprotein-releasing system ATP-binding protein
MSQLVVENVVKEFPTRGEPLVILRGVSFQLAAGENLAVLGPSGSGKSTLLHVIGTLDAPTSGKVFLGGENPFDLAEPALARFRNKNIGFIFQEHHLLPQLTVLENVLVPALANGRPDKLMVERAHDLLERVGLAERLDHRPAELSGGERQRVAVARALLLKPALLLGDEPTGSLDRTNALAVGRLLLELQLQEKNMLIVVTHSREIGDLLERKMEIDDGRLKGGRMKDER